MSLQSAGTSARRRSHWARSVSFVCPGMPIIRSAETFPIARPRFLFLEWFEGIVVSGEVRAAKPDERIFSHLVERFGLEGASTVFIDDSEANVAAAAALGFQTIRYEDADQLRARLVELALLEPV